MPTWPGWDPCFSGESQYKLWECGVPALRDRGWREGIRILVINSTRLGFKLKVENIIFFPIKVKPWVIFFYCCHYYVLYALKR